MSMFFHWYQIVAKPTAKVAPGLGHRVLGVGAGAERLAHHDPPGQLAVAEEIAAAGADSPGHPQPEDRDADEVDDQDDPVQNRKPAGCRHR